MNAWKPRYTYTASTSASASAVLCVTARVASSPGVHVIFLVKIRSYPFSSEVDGLV